LRPLANAIGRAVSVGYYSSGGQGAASETDVSVSASHILRVGREATATSRRLESSVRL